MKILFLSRAYPPVTGGIENQNYALSVWLKRFVSVDTIANRYGKKALFFFLPYATLRALFSVHRYDVVLLGDGVLAIVGGIIKLLYPKKPVVAILHGLDILYQNPVYQYFWVRRFIPALDGLITVSQETRATAINNNIPAERILVIQNGVNTEALQGNYTRNDLTALLGVDTTDTYILLTTGRLAKRKGAAWFIRKVLPFLPKNTLYVLAGSGPEKANIEVAIRESQTQGQVKLLGHVTDATRNLLLNTADIFIQPNIRVPGDMEGFGIAVIEATACGRPVVAADLEGLRDAICPNENGILVEPENPEAFQKAILSLMENANERQSFGERARQYTERTYHWNVIARLYIEALNTFIRKVK